jgi:aryl-alcohol dehydrogenase-like predicted oxidoreductase
VAWPWSPRRCSPPARSPASTPRPAPPDGTSPAALAIAFALANPLVCSVLFGATTPEQLAANLEAVEVSERLDPEQLAALRALS